MLVVFVVGPGKLSYERFLPGSLWILLSLWSLYHNFCSLKAWEGNLSKQVICLPSALGCKWEKEEWKLPINPWFSGFFAPRIFWPKQVLSEASFFFLHPPPPLPPEKAENWVKNKNEEKEKIRSGQSSPRSLVSSLWLCFMISDTTDCEPAMFGNSRWLNLLARCKCNLCLLMTVWELPSFSKSLAGPALFTVTNTPAWSYNHNVLPLYFSSIHGYHHNPYNFNCPETEGKNAEQATKNLKDWPVSFSASSPRGILYQVNNKKRVMID